MGVKMKQTKQLIKRGLINSMAIAGLALGAMTVAAGVGIAALIATIEIQTRWGDQLVWPF